MVKGEIHLIWDKILQIKEVISDVWKGNQKETKQFCDSPIKLNDAEWLKYDRLHIILFGRYFPELQIRTATDLRHTQREINITYNVQWWYNGVGSRYRAKTAR